MSEHDEQVNFVRWFRLQYPREVIFAIPNGAHLAGDARVRAMKMNKLKAEGFLAGVSDLFIMAARGKYHGLFIEMKAEKGKPQQSQIDFIADADRLGYKAAICYGLDDAVSVVKDYFKNI